MARPWERDLYKPLNMANIQGYPNKMLTDVNKWFPKFPRNNVITVEDHIYVMGRDMDNAGIDHEDVAMKLFASSLLKKLLIGSKDSLIIRSRPMMPFPLHLKADGQENQMVGHLQLSSIK
jgi:hypothetical protein